MAITFLIFVYWLVANLLGYKSTSEMIEHVAWPLALCALCGVGLLFHMALRPGVSHCRRVIGLLADLGALSAALYLGDGATALLYPIYLWAIFGNGFRYGLGYLVLSAALSIAGFGAVVATTPFWQEHLEMSCSLALALLVLPAYTGVLIRKLSAARLAAEEAVRAKTLFLASVSHELRTPLNAIVGLSDLLTDSLSDREQLDMVRTIGRSGRSLASLINSILDVSRMEIGKLPTRMEEADLPLVMHGIREMLSVQGSAKDLLVAIHIDARTPRRLLLNLGHLEEILVNLGGNAVKFTQVGQVLIHVAPVSFTEGCVRLRFEVRDTGIGIAPEARERIFERFAQADATIIDRYGGTGLGLSIVKQLVEGGGGRIGVDSTVGVGSVFWFELDASRTPESAPETFDRPVILVTRDGRLLDVFGSICADLGRFDDFDAFLASRPESIAWHQRPVLAIDEASLGVKFAAAAEWFSRDVGGKPWPAIWLRADTTGPGRADHLSRFVASLGRDATRDQIGAALAIAIDACGGDSTVAPGAGSTGAALDILVAEDNKTNQMVIQKILETVGHRVTIADNGERALEAMGATRFDLVLMDVNMPVLNGIEATKLARFIELDIDPVPIVALTADATQETRRRCLEAGMTDCMTKPIDRPKLLAWLAGFEASRRKAEPSDAPTDTAETAASAAVASDGAVDHRALQDLEALGGKEFVDQIVDQFVSDATTVMRELSHSVAKGDAYAFRDHAHALRSCAANVGARQVYDLCLSWRAIDSAEIAIRGEEHMRKLEEEFERTREALRR